MEDRINKWDSGARPDTARSRTHALTVAFDAHVSNLRNLLNDPHISSSSAREHVAPEWDLTEHTLEQLLIEVRAQRNSSIPAISRLPLDVLTSIFHEVAVQDPPHISIPESALGALDEKDARDEFDGHPLDLWPN